MHTVCQCIIQKQHQNINEKTLLIRVQTSLLYDLTIKTLNLKVLESMLCITVSVILFQTYNYLILSQNTSTNKFLQYSQIGNSRGGSWEFPTFYEVGQLQTTQNKARQVCQTYRVLRCVCCRCLELRRDRPLNSDLTDSVSIVQRPLPRPTHQHCTRNTCTNTQQYNHQNYEQLKCFTESEHDGKQIIT